MPDDGAQVRTSQAPYDAVPCWLRDLGLHAYTTYAALLSFERSRGCFPSVATLAGAAMISERACRSALRVLERVGAIRTDLSKGRTSNTYHLLAHGGNPAAVAEPEPPTRQDVQGATRQDVQPMSDEGLSSQNDEPIGSSARVRRDVPGASVDVDAVCEALADHVERVTDRPRPTYGQAWRRQARLMLDGPGKLEPEWTREQLEHVITWLGGPTKDAQFWSANVLSMDALRRQMPRLVAAIKREHRERTAGGSGAPRQTHADLAAMAARARARDEARAAS